MLIIIVSSLNKSTNQRRRDNIHEAGHHLINNKTRKQTSNDQFAGTCLFVLRKILLTSLAAIWYEIKVVAYLRRSAALEQKVRNILKPYWKILGMTRHGDVLVLIHIPFYFFVSVSMYILIILNKFLEFSINSGRDNKL